MRGGLGRAREQFALRVPAGQHLERAKLRQYPGRRCIQFDPALLDQLHRCRADDWLGHGGQPHHRVLPDRHAAALRTHAGGTRVERRVSRRHRRHHAWHIAIGGGAGEQRVNRLLQCCIPACQHILQSIGGRRMAPAKGLKRSTPNIRLHQGFQDRWGIRLKNQKIVDGFFEAALIHPARELALGQRAQMAMSGCLGSIELARKFGHATLSGLCRKMFKPAQGQVGSLAPAARGQTRRECGLGRSDSWRGSVGVGGHAASGEG